MENELKGTGAEASELDPRTVTHKPSDLAGAVILTTGGIHYEPGDIEDQHRVGICTAISRVQMRQKQTGKKYSPDFQYLLQKKYIDQNWYEGSSPLSSNKVAKTYGFLPIELFTWITENDRYLPYNQYIAKLQAIPLEEILRLLKLCVDPIAGYAQVNVHDPELIAKAILESPGQSGILCRYGCQKNWWTPSWAAKDIEPLRWAPETSGHQVINSFFDYTKGKMLEIPNTWGVLWARKGLCFVNNENYPITEAWVDLETAPVINNHPVTRKGNKGPVVKELQTLLNKKGAVPVLIVDGDFGNKTFEAVKQFQTKNSLVVDGIVGPSTWKLLLN